MWSPWKKDRAACAAFRESLEVCDLAAADRAGNGYFLAALPEAQQQHAAQCRGCEARARDFLETRFLLKAIPSNAAASRPWFAPRVMAAISAQESKLSRALETWTAVPRLAAKFTWVSVCALLLASTWLYTKPPGHSANASGTDLTGEPVFEAAPPPATNDDVLVSLVEKSR